MPFAQHFLEQIVNVQWAGDAAVAVLGMKPGYRFDKQSDPDNSAPQEYKEIDIGGDGFGLCATYAMVNGETTKKGEATIEVGGTPTFLVCGFTSSAESTASLDIYVSHDGENWNPALKASRGVGGGGGGAFRGIVWDSTAKKFYALCDIWADITADEVGVFRIYSSADGVSWSMDNEWVETRDTGSAQAEAAETAFRVHFVKPENKKDGTPDGLTGYDYKKKIYMKPTGLNGWGIGGPNREISGNSIDIKSDDPDTPDKSVSIGLSAVWSVVWNGGVWNATGLVDDPLETPSDSQHVAVYCSKDSGKTWKEVLKITATNPWCLCSAARSDVQRWISENT